MWPSAFDDERQERFDLVIGADGIHSGIRELAMGPEGNYVRPLGYRVATYRVPNRYHLGRVMMNPAEVHRARTSPCAGPQCC